LTFFNIFLLCIDLLLIFDYQTNKTKQNTMKKLNAFLTIGSVLIACTGLFFAMFGQFEIMLLCISTSFITSLLIKLN
jgi:hypothetical protein